MAPCPTCGAVLRSRASFAAHLRSHNLEKVFSCKVCGRAFKRNYDLKVSSGSAAGTYVRNRAYQYCTYNPFKIFTGIWLLFTEFLKHSKLESRELTGTVSDLDPDLPIFASWIRTYSVALK